MIVDGITYDIPVVSLKRTGDFLDKYAKRTEDGVLHRKLIGVYYNYSLQLGSSRTVSAPVYQALWDKLTEPVEFHTVVVPDSDRTYTFTAYFSNVGDELKKQKDNRNYWQNLTVDFTAQSPARTPS